MKQIWDCVNIQTDLENCMFQMLPSLYYHGKTDDTLCKGEGVFARWMALRLSASIVGWQVAANGKICQMVDVL
jgi:hypothetical protein